jgi:hypothetical protein
VTGIAFAGVLLNVVIWYGLPQLVGTSQAVADTKPIPHPDGSTPASTSAPDLGRTDVPGVHTSGSPSAPAHPATSASPSRPDNGKPAVPGRPQTPVKPPVNQPPPVHYRSVTAQHGSASFKYSSGHIEVVSTDPSDGWQVSSGRVSDNLVAVQFTSGKQKETIFAGVDKNGTFQYDVSESTDN